jgi:hypothetical protein
MRHTCLFSLLVRNWKSVKDLAIPTIRAPALFSSHRHTVTIYQQDDGMLQEWDDCASFILLSQLRAGRVDHVSS